VDQAGADKLREQLAVMQGQHDARKAEIEAIQAKLREAELHDQAESLLDSLPPDERGVLIEVAAIRIGAKPGDTKAV
jgi:hypothetical protein